MRLRTQSASSRHGEALSSTLPRSVEPVSVVVHRKGLWLLPQVAGVVDDRSGVEGASRLALSKATSGFSFAGSLPEAKICDQAVDLVVAMKAMRAALSGSGFGFAG